MTKEEMVIGFRQGRRLVQESWSHRDEIDAVDELVAEGVARATSWRYSDLYQCDCRTAVGAAGEAK